MPALHAASRALRLLLRPLALTALALSTTAAMCGDDDGAPAPDAPVSLDGSPGDGTPAIDAPMGTCNLPSQIIHCTVGDNGPCTAVCPTAYCYNFQMVGVLCTKPCSGGGDCPSGWSCNMMGRCRPPGVQ
ncbi:MAG TPA: hypothetical protein VHE35_07580 [Kofleriaceae bacterium]|nr:hypothetical protein [Kofleriaceae bacterium]